MNLQSSSENASGRKIVVPEEDKNYDDQKSYSDYDEYTNYAANVVKLNWHLIMDAGILEKALNETMVCKTCGTVSIMENRNCHESLGTKLVLRCNNSRYKSETSFFHSTHKNKCRKTYQINTLSILGIKALRKERNAALKLLAILNLGKPVSHVT